MTPTSRFVDGSIVSILFGDGLSWIDQSPAGGHPPPTRRVDTVREMVRGLDALTGAGQRYTMGKVVDFIVTELRDRCPGSSQQARSLSRTVDRIATEVGRQAPAVRPFRRRAEILLSMLQMGTT
jgi:hypothetical protein